jgi:hypothetical protein
MSYELKKFKVTIINGYCKQIELLWVHVCYPEKQQVVTLCANEQQRTQTISPLVISGHIEYDIVIKYHLTNMNVLNTIYEDIAVLLTQHGCDFTYHDIDYYNIM